MNTELKFIKIRDVKLPVRAHETDAGIDFFVPNDFTAVTLKPGEDAVIPAGIKVIVPRGYALVYMGKSGVCTKQRLAVGASVVDSDYRGEVHLHLYNAGTKDVEILPGAKIIQGLLLPVGLGPVTEITEEEYNLDTTERGTGGFGSTGSC